jgi:hypothetical protein
MKSTRLLSLILLGLARVASAADAPSVAEAASAATESAPEAAAAPVAGSDMCFYANPPTDAKYTVLASKLKASKGTYGSVREMLPKLAAEVRAVGGDAVINFNGGQHFGFWPWRMTHPIVSGGAIKWSSGQAAPDCEATGGSLMSKIMATDKAPVRDKK